MSRTMAVVLLVLFPGTAGMAQPARTASTAAARTEATQAIAESSARLSELDAVHARIVQSNADLSKMYSALSRKIGEAQKLMGDPARAQEQLKQIQEMTQGFNVQYLQLQQKMQDESRQFTLLSNVMKTKHDTAKNSISNIR